MSEFCFQVRNELGNVLKIERDEDGMYELVTEFDRRVVSEAYVESLWRKNAKFNKSAWYVSGGLPSLGKKRH